MTANDRGFTVIEIVVAITIFSVGILSLAATSSLVTRMVGEGHQYSEASSIANQRLELLRSQNCATLGTGTDVQGAYNISWSADSVGSRTPGQRVTVTVIFPTASGARAANFSSVFSCSV